MNNECRQLPQQNSAIACRHSQRVFLACWILVSSFFVCSGRCWAQAPTSSMDTAARSKVVEAAAKALEDRYIFPDLGRAMANKIRQENAAHAYDALTTGTDFSNQLTADLYFVGHDKHIHVDSDDRRLVIQERPGTGGPRPRPRSLEGPPPAARVSEFKRLTGNIGYIRVDQMLPAHASNESIDTAMAALTDSKALIIDLRHNGGGDPMMVAYLCTYLFPVGARIHLNDFVDRDDPAPRASYTLPSVPGKTFAGDVYVLTSHFTFSGGEEMAYDLQALKRATIVGETTGGGANPGGPVPLPYHFSIFIPTGRPINPVTKTNWEGVGVQPDVSVPADEALEKAKFLALGRTGP
jgi:retinol-binding protein 3